MKKYLLIVTVFALGLSFVACGGKKGEVKSEEPAQEVVVEVDVLTKYETAINKAIELQGKVAAGDVAAVEEFTKVSEEIATVAAEIQEASAGFTEEQTQKLTELAEKWAAAVAPKEAQP